QDFRSAAANCVVYSSRAISRRTSTIARTEPCGRKFQATTVSTPCTGGSRGPGATTPPAPPPCPVGADARAAPPPPAPPARRARADREQHVAGARPARLPKLSERVTGGGEL